MYIYIYISVTQIQDHALAQNTKITICALIVIVFVEWCKVASSLAMYSV